MSFAETNAILTPIDELRAGIAGTVVLPGDLDYDAARRAWNLTVEQHPAVILIAENAQDIAEGVRFARANGLGIAVQATGHGVILPANDALLIITAHLNDVVIDAAAQTAWVSAGVKWSVVLEMAQQHGLAPLLGSSPTVGAIGYTLGGGMGWLARKYGLSADSVLEFEVVTADGEVIEVSDARNSDLFWGLRGGGGSFAIVTGMRIRLYPVTTVYGGSLIYPIEQAKEVFTFFREWIKWLPDEWTASIAVMHMPEDPALPPFLNGKSVVMVNGCYCGPVEHGHLMLHTWLEWNAPIFNGFRPMPFTEVGLISNDPQDPMPGKSTGAWLADLSDETIDTLLAHVGQSSTILKTEIRYAGGAIARIHDNVNAYGHRHDTLLLQCVGITPTPEAFQQVVQASEALKAALQSHLTGGVYMNFIEGDEARERTHSGYTQEKVQRLADLKAKYDPDNLFRFGYKFTGQR